MPSVTTAMPTIGKSRYLPVRLMICPLPMEAISRPAISGNSCSPDAVAEAPRTTCWYCGR